MPKDSEALVQAVTLGDVEQVKNLIAGSVSVNEPDALGRLPLAAAATRGKTELVRLLLDAGANVQFAGLRSG